MPDLSFEVGHGGIVAGIDEAGRGPWAGPVVAAAVILDPTNLPSGIDDSKRLTRRRRREVFERLVTNAQFGVGLAGVGEIDRLNILAATLLAMRRAFDALPVRPLHALIDGTHLPSLPCSAEAIVKGDSVSLSIAAASIIAKVTRDDLMARLALTHPGYGWERNAGYGTKEHREALLQQGVTPHHRHSWAPIRKMLSQDSSLSP